MIFEISKIILWKSLLIEFDMALLDKCGREYMGDDIWSFSEIPRCGPFCSLRWHQIDHF